MREEALSIFLSNILPCAWYTGCCKEAATAETPNTQPNTPAAGSQRRLMLSHKFCRFISMASLDSIILFLIGGLQWYLAKQIIALSRKSLIEMEYLDKD